MPVVYQSWILKEDLEKNPGNLYLFGDNERRTGRGGQARECRGMKNAIGVRTKRYPSALSDKAFWTDDTFISNVKMMREDLEPAIEHLKKGKTVVILLHGLGTGLSEMPKRCPETFKALQRFLEELETIGYTE